MLVSYDLLSVDESELSTWLGRFLEAFDEPGIPRAEVREKWAGRDRFRRDGITWSVAVF